MRTVVVANSYDSDPGFVGERLVERGASLRFWHREFPAEWDDLDTVDLVLLLGSDWSVYWDHVAESVAAESAMVAEADRRGIPVFGICFGAQMLAHTLGGSVGRAPEPEVGWFEVESDVPELAGRWFQWHADRVVVPAAAELMATSPRAQQAFNLRRNLALQFHPEVSTAIVQRWIDGGGAAEAAKYGIDPDQLVADCQANTPSSRDRCSTLVDWFCARWL